MKNLLFFTLLCMTIGTSCSKEETKAPHKQEITSIDDVGQYHAAEILRLNMNKTYGGVFRLMELQHEKIFIEQVPCDSTFNYTVFDENDPAYTLSMPIEMTTDCQKYWNVYNDRFYFNTIDKGIQTVASDSFALEVEISETQTIAGNSEDDVFTYSHFGFRNILITEGIAPEIDPTAILKITISNDEYDKAQVELNGSSVINFELEIKTNEGSPVPIARKDFTGTIKMINNLWTVIFEDGNQILL